MQNYPVGKELTINKASDMYSVFVTILIISTVSENYFLLENYSQKESHLIGNNSLFLVLYYISVTHPFRLGIDRGN